MAFLRGRTVEQDQGKKFMYLDLPKGVKWFLKGANLPSLRVSLAPLGRCWYNNESMQKNKKRVCDDISDAYFLQNTSMLNLTVLP